MDDSVTGIGSISLEMTTVPLIILRNLLVIPLLKLMTLGPGGVKQLSQGHLAGKDGARIQTAHLSSERHPSLVPFTLPSCFPTVCVGIR